MSLGNSEQNVKAVPSKVFVIVPVYNVDPWIRRSLDSLVNQTLKDIEIGVINDGSQDNCPEIIDEYAKKIRTLLLYIRKIRALVELFIMACLKLQESI